MKQSKNRENVEVELNSQCNIAYPLREKIVVYFQI